MSLHRWTFAALLGLSAAPLEAHAADRVQQCIGEHVEAQLARKKGQLLAARGHLEQCSASSCPTLLRQECAALKQGVEADLPSVVVGAIGADGQPTTAPRVSIDQATTLLPLGGQPIPLDPGEHVLRFQLPSGELRELKIVLAESERERRVVADFRPSTSLERAPEERSWPKVVLYTSIGVGAAAVGSFTIFALSGRSLESDLDRCKPRCSDAAEVDRMRSRYLIADISLGVALVAAGVGTYAWLQRAPSPPSGSSQGSTLTSFSVQPLVNQRELGLAATGAF
jgi:hypothetical protein